MEPSLHSASMTAYASGLAGLLGLIDRAAGHLAGRPGDEASLLRRSLATRLHPLGRQILAACGHAERDPARVAALDLPPRAEAPMTLPALRARVERALAFVRSVPPERINNNADRRIRDGWSQMSGADYLRLHSIPHFYFHLTVVYLTLRQSGVPVGKADFVGPAFEAPPLERVSFG